MRHIQHGNGDKSCDLFVFEDMSSVIDYTDGKLFQVQSESFLSGERLPNWDDVIKRTIRPWAEGAFIINEFVQKLQAIELPNLFSHRRQVMFNDEDGDEVDYDRLISGEPMWRKAERELATGPTQVTVFVDVSASGSVSGENIFWRGAAAVALVSLLEKKGYSVELWMTDGGQFLAKTCRVNRNCRTLEAVCLKRGSDTLDIMGICNSLGGWFYRTVIFTLMSTIADKIGEKLASAYGPAIVPSQNQFDELSVDELRITVAGVFSFNEALECVKGELVKISKRNGV